MKKFLPLLITLGVLITPAWADQTHFLDVIQRAQSYLQKKDYRSAEKLSKVALSEAKKTFGPESLQASNAKYLLMKIYTAKGDKRKAAALQAELNEMAQKLFTTQTARMQMLWEHYGEVPNSGGEQYIKLSLKDDPDQFMVVVTPGLTAHLNKLTHKEITVNFRVVVDQKTNYLRSYEFLKIGGFVPDKSRIMTRINYVKALQQ